MSPTNDFDGAWKEAMERYFPRFLDICFPDIAQRIDWSRGYEFLDQELQEVVRDAEMGKLRTDKLVKVYRLDGAEEWLLIHVELQSQPDKNLPQRMYHYRHRIVDRYGHPVVSVVVLADENAAWRPAVYEEEQWGCRLRFEYLVCKLLDFDLAALEASVNPIAMVILAHRAAQTTANAMENRFNIKWRLTRRLYELGYAKGEILSLYRLLDWLLAMPKEMELEFRRKVVAYEKENVMPYITNIERIGREEGLMQGLEEGLQKGRQEGRQEGLRAGQVALLLRQLRRRWGQMDSELEVRLQKMSVVQLEALGEAMLDFHEPTDLQRWLSGVENRGN